MVYNKRPPSRPLDRQLAIYHNLWLELLNVFLVADNMSVKRGESSQKSGSPAGWSSDLHVSPRRDSNFQPESN